MYSISYFTISVQFLINCFSFVSIIDEENINLKLRLNLSCLWRMHCFKLSCIIDLLRTLDLYIWIKFIFINKSKTKHIDTVSIDKCVYWQLKNIRLVWTIKSDVTQQRLFFERYVRSIPSYFCNRHNCFINPSNKASSAMHQVCGNQCDATQR